MNPYQTYYRKHRTEFIYGGVLLEGKIATFAQTEEVIRGLRGVGLPDFSRLVIENLVEMWSYLFTFSVGDDVMSSTYVLRNLQSGLSNGVQESELEVAYRGRFRDFPVEIGGSSYKPPVANALMMEQLCQNWMNEVRANPTVTNILTLYVRLMKAQFFANTNKRTAYVFTNLLLYVHNTGYLLKLPKTAKASKNFVHRVVNYYEDDRKEQELVNYIKRYLLKDLRDVS